MTGEPWTPSLTDVASCVPTRTRDTKTPGSDKLLMTFNANTTPSDAQAQQTIDDVAAALEAEVGDVPNILAQHPDLATAMRVYVQWRTAADIELSYPNRDNGPQVYTDLSARADKAYKTILGALAVTDSGAIETEPQWQMPKPAPWGDTSPGSGADYAMGPV